GSVPMARSAAYDDILMLDAVNEPDLTVGTSARAFKITATHRPADVESMWRSLTEKSVESPGQSIGFIRLWIKALNIAERDQFYVVAHLDDTPIALVPLQRRWDKGARVLSWFPGAHVGCNAPIVDVARVQA